MLTKMHRAAVGVTHTHTHTHTIESRNNLDLFAVHKTNINEKRRLVYAKLV